VQGNREAVIRETADLMYNLVVVLAEAGIAPDEIWREMDRREQMYGIAEKLPKPRAASASRPVELYPQVAKVRR
jgi:phosphoribosyl-ATP pyrophosphohydrolase